MGTRTVKGICGQVDGSVIPGLIGLEAGQSAFGDLLAWFGDLISWPMDNLVLSSEILTPDQKIRLREEMDSNLIRKLTEAAERITSEESLPIALDWINGRRTPDADQELKSAIS
jgi:L-ribulokinase